MEVDTWVFCCDASIPPVVPTGLLMIVLLAWVRLLVCDVSLLLVVELLLLRQYFLLVLVLLLELNDLRLAIAVVVFSVVYRIHLLSYRRGLEAT